jgi:hypothetical protein
MMLQISNLKKIVVGLVLGDKVFHFACNFANCFMMMKLEKGTNVQIFSFFSIFLQKGSQH